MAIIVNFAGASLRKPGAYSRIKVAQGQAAEAQLGVVAIIGEADQGNAFSAESGISAYTFTPDQYNDIQAKFGSGSLVDAARLVLSPSNDPQILGGAQQLLVVKTNQSAKASVAIPSGYGTAYAKSAGTKGNNTSVEIANSSGQRIITIADALTGDKEVSAAIGGKTVFTIQITGGASAATMTITSNKLTTTVTGGSAPSLTIPFSQFSNIEQLVEYLDGQTGYAVTIGSNDQKSAPLSVMDQVTAVDVFTAPYLLVRDSYDIRAFFNESSLATFTPTLYAGLPAVMSKTFMSGGTLGATTNANIQSAFDELLKARVNFVVPLFSRDASADVSDNLTDASSTYTIDSIHAIAKTHCNQASTVKGKKERQAFLGYKGTYSSSKDKAAGINAARAALCFQDVDIVNAFGDIVTAQPHMLSVCSAGMKAAAVVGLPNTFKQANILGFSHSGFDPETQADDAIDANLTFVEKAPGGGFRFVLDNSTYGQTKDAWIYNRPSVLYAADIAAFSIRLNVEQFVGQRNSDITPETVKNLLVSVFDGLRNSGIIVPDEASGGKGFKDLVVTFEGSVIKVSVTLILVEGFEFVLNDITVQRATA